ncbi:MAG: DUF4422 domain-containing protein [Lachnospiraceae bacterium]|nr:DUF4422 domain-containing protein [Lachnospiraceae bacterium]
MDRSIEIEKIKTSDHIVIYGAGTMGKAVYRCLHEKPYYLTIDGFIVKSLDGNPDNIDGIPVVALSDAEGFKDALVLVALNGKLIPEVVTDLENCGFIDILPVSFDGDLWTDIRYAWIRANHILPKNVLFLSDQDEDAPLDASDSDGKREDLSIYVVHSIYDRELSETSLDKEYEIPIQVGAALTDKHLFPTLDSSGEDNISSKNRQYCELTGIYWAWKNDRSDYIGFSHYRRKFELTDEQIDHFMQVGVDVVVTCPIINFETVRSQYGKDHIIDDWDTLMDVIKEMAPDYYESALKVQDEIYYYAYNMFIMKRDIFDKYCSFIFPLLSECEERIGEREDVYQNRYVGFLAEGLLSVFLTKNADLKVAMADKRFYE